MSCLTVDFRFGGYVLSSLITKTVNYSLSFTFIFFAGAELKRYIGIISHKSNIIQGMNRDIVYAFVQAIEAKDPYLNNHSKNVSYYARELARQLQLPKTKITCHPLTWAWSSPHG
jgi:HD-GYP domain-containing protein (c-di-GMP phosphodiesterase class II)